MSGSATEAGKEAGQGWATLARFLPYLWPAGEPRLKARVVAAVMLVLAAKGATLTMPFAYKAVVDRMAAGMDAALGIAVALVLAYAGARFGGVLFDNLRNAIFERVGQDAARRLAERVFRHIHALSLRFHLERRTGALTKIVERGTKSIDMMLYSSSSTSPRPRSSSPPSASSSASNSAPAWCWRPWSWSSPTSPSPEPSPNGAPGSSAR